MDGRFKDKMLLASIATSNVDEISGPTEIVLNYHQKNIPYWKFLLLPKKKMKLKLKLGDLMIRKHCLWHRGTINRSKNSRFVIAFLIFEKTVKNEYSLYEDSDEIKIYNNFFGNSLLERLKEFLHIPSVAFFKDAEGKLIASYEVAAAEVKADAGGGKPGKAD
jgi:hypothetical protein